MKTYLQLYSNPQPAFALHLGNTKVQRNYQTAPQMLNLVKREVSAIILRYVNHRERALRHYNQLDPVRAYAIQRIRDRFAYPEKWHAANLKAKILGIAEDLRLLLPPYGSRFYNSQNKLVSDLAEFAKTLHPTEYLQ